MLVRKIKNISESDVSVKINPYTTVHLSPQQELEDVEVCNLESISKFVSVEYDLSEVNPVNEGREKLFD